MCGRFTLRKSVQEIAAQFGLTQSTLELAPTYNAAPSQMLPIIRNHGGQMELLPVKWGLVPPWAAKDGHLQKALINARAEGIATKPAFRRSLRSQRCIVPSDGFLEWAKTPSGKQPYFIHRRDDALYGYAGLYETTRDPAGEPMYTFTIITCEANDVVAPIHDRMPVILPLEAEEEWLAADITDPVEIEHWLRPYPAALMEAYPVSKRVNAVANNDASLLANSA